MQRHDVATTMDLTQSVRLEAGFVRAANLDDIGSLEDLPRLKVTPNIVRALSQITTAMHGSRERAWAVVGPYGAGKSTFALLVAALLTGKWSSPWIAQALKSLEEADTVLGRRLREITRSKAYIPVLLQGEPQPFAQCLLERIIEVDASLDFSLLDGVDYRGLLSRMRSGHIEPQKVVRLIERAVGNSRRAGYAGLVIIADEFGRFLDQLHSASVRQNLAFAQELAELSSRTRRGELHLFVVLHQNFEDYAVGITVHERTEWSKIQGRFRQLALSEDPDNLYGLLARCINVDNGVARLAEKVMGEAWELVKDFPPFKGSAREWKSRLLRLFPLHPLAVYSLPRLSSRLGQNERTIFSFLLSDEPYSFRGFLRRAHSNGDSPLLGLDWLCDYFLFNHATSLVPLRFRRRLAQLNFALERLSGRESLATKIVKVVGILELLESTELRPTEGVIAAALNIRDEDDWGQFRVALKHLTSQRVLVARRYAGEFHLLPGSDFDVTEAVAEAADRWRASEMDTGAFLNDHLEPPPVIARRHSFETGTVRVAGRIFVEPARLAAAAPREQGWKAINESPDLTIEYVVCSDSDEVAFAERWVRKCRLWDRIFVVPREPVAIHELCVQIRALQEISSHEEVKADPIAKQEVDLHFRHMSSLLRNRVQRVLDATSGCARWFWRGREVQVSTERDVQSLVSNICNALFSRSPKIANELVNRRQLSSASVVAVKKIVSGLLESQDRPGLGFKGNGPEVTIFHAVFERTGWHRHDGSGYRLLPPGRAYRLRPAWSLIQRFLNSTVRERRPLSLLWDELARPPYGIRAGLAPLLIWGALIERRGECCLYERGTYVPSWSPELYDRFLRTPGEFEVRCVSGTPLPSVLLGLSEVLPKTPGACDQISGVNDFLQRLFGWYRALPDYTKRTNALSPKAKEFRRTISTATDPVELVFRQLPESLHLGSLFDLPPRRNVYQRQFRRVVGELSRAYSRLLDSVVERLAALLGTARRLEAVQAELAQLKEALEDDLTDAASKAFLLRAANRTDDTAAWAESVGAAVAGQPPRFWTDQTIKEFDERLAIIIHQIRQTQRAQTIRSQAGLSPGAKVKWLTVATPQATLIDEVIFEGGLSSDGWEALSTAEDVLGRLVGKLDTRQRRQVLVELIARIWGKTEP